MKIYNGVMEKVRKIEEKNGITYAKTDGRLYKTLKVLYIIVFIYGLGINLLYLLGMSLQYSDKADVLAKYLITPAVCTVALIAGFIFLMKRFHITALPLSVVPAAVLIFFFIPIMEGEYVNTLNPQYYIRHLTPMALTILLVGGMCYIGIRASFKFQKLYKGVVAKLYDTYQISAENGGDLSEEEWDKFLSAYDPNQYTAQFLKKAKKESNVQAE